MKIQRSIIWYNHISLTIIDMVNTSNKHLFITLIKCDGGIIGDFDGKSKSGKSYVIVHYNWTDEEYDYLDGIDGNACCVNTVFLPTSSEVLEIPKCSWDARLPTSLILCILPHDHVCIAAEQHEVYKLIDDYGNEIPLEDLLGRKKQSASP